MPRAGLTAADLVMTGATIADEAGLGALTLAAVAERLGVRAPALYKHVGGIDDLRRRLATLAMTELGDALRDDLQGKAGREALASLFGTLRTYIEQHPGRYAATTGMALGPADQPLFLAATRVMDSVRAVLLGYGLPPESLDHAIRTLRCTVEGFAALQLADGFQWGNDPDETVEWMVTFFDGGLERVSRGDS